MRSLIAFLLLTATACGQSILVRGVTPVPAPEAPVAALEPFVAVEAGQQPSPDAAIDEALRALKLTSSDILLDPGCGDGRVLIKAVEDYGCRGVGFEIDPHRADIARLKVQFLGLADRVQIFTADSRWGDFSKATAVYVYMWPDVLAELSSKMKGKRVVSAFHEIAGLPGGQHRGDLWLYIPQSMPVVTFYTNSTCGICRSAKAAVDRGALSGTTVVYQEVWNTKVPYFTYVDDHGRQKTYHGWSTTTFDEILKDMGLSRKERRAVQSLNTVPTAVWGNVRYTAPVCSNRNCTMCWSGSNSIARQLGLR